MKIREISRKMIKIKKHYASLSKKPGFKVYGESTIKYKGKEYRIWDPTKSKLGAALHKGLPLNYIKEIEKANNLLYLGIANGTTASHIEDLNSKLNIYGVEISPRSMIDLVYMIKKRNSNIIPILENAAHPTKYSFMLTSCDIIYVDIAQPHQTDIALKNAKIYLKNKGLLFITIKTRSIDITKKPKEIVKKEEEKIKQKNYKILYSSMLDPYEKDHGFIIAQKI